MQDGFLKVAVATPTVRVADCDFNTAQMISLVDQAAKQQVKLLVLPELCVTGYTCGDLFLQSTLQTAVEQSICNIAEATRGRELLLAVGAPLTYCQKRYNCAVVCYDGRILGVVPKTHLPNYGEFQELRYFSSADTLPPYAELTLAGETVPFSTELLFQAEECPLFTVGFEICEDLWVMQPPSITHAMAGALIIGNLSASNETIGKDSYRRDLVCGQSGRLFCGYLYASAGEGESTTDLVFSAHNLIAEDGVLLAESFLFANSMVVSELDLERMANERLRHNASVPSHLCDEYLTIPFSLTPQETTLTRFVSPQPFVPTSALLAWGESEQDHRLQEIFLMQAMGLKKRMEHIGAACVVLGLSGGLDSTLALLASVKTIDLLERPRTDVVAVSMPCFGTTSRTQQNAKLLAEALGVTFWEIPIAAAVRQHFADIKHQETDRDTTYENAQARERTQVLMDLANQRNGLVVGTGDLSELALGFATYNGDHMAMYSLNSSIPKTLVRHLVSYVAYQTDHDRLSQVLQDVLDTPVSPELLPPAEDASASDTIKQKTEEIVGPYELHDFFLYYVVRFGYSPKKIYRLACYAFQSDQDEPVYDAKTILHWLKLFYQRFFAGQFKRSCSPDGVKIGSVSLSPRGDFRMPSDAVASCWLSQLDTI